MDQGVGVMIAEFPWAIAESVERDFLTRVRPLDADFPVLPRGIWTSEMFAFCVWMVKYDVRQVVESGVYNGQSTLALTRFLSPGDGAWGDGAVWSIDQNHEALRRAEALLAMDARRRTWWQGVHGDAEHYMISTVDRFCGDRPVALLLDGPKGEPAIRLACDMLDGYPNVAFAAIHDLYRPTPPRQSIARTMLDCLSRRIWTTDAETFVMRYKYLDGEHHAKWLDERGCGKMPYRYIGATEEFAMESYGPCLGFIFR